MFPRCVMKRRGSTCMTTIDWNLPHYVPETQSRKFERTTELHPGQVFQYSVHSTRQRGQNMSFRDAFRHNDTFKSAHLKPSYTAKQSSQMQKRLFVAASVWLVPTKGRHPSQEKKRPQKRSTCSPQKLSEESPGTLPGDTI